MALQAATSVPQPPPQVIGSAFVQQYYHILHQSPESVYKFYQDTSMLSRSDADGVMTSVTTMQAINEKILSLDFHNCFTEIETADSQLSYMNGVFIVVTGTLIGTDNVKRKFTQSFFLAPQQTGGYFVLNDVFRFIKADYLGGINQLVVNESENNGADGALTPEPEPTPATEHDIEVNPVSKGIADLGDEVVNPSEDSDFSGVENGNDVDPPVQVTPGDAQEASQAAATVSQENVPKKSYASIVKVMKGSPSPAPIYVPVTKPNTLGPNPEKPRVVPTTPANAPETTVPNDNSAPENNESHDVEGYSVYIRNLPLNATAEQVEEEFKKFGTIKPGGVQVRNHKIERFCFGFVEFESLKSMQDAIEASPVLFGGRQVYVEEKKTTTRVVNGVVTHSGNSSGRGRYPAGRGGFRNDSYRGGRGASVGNGNGGNYKRGEFRNRGADYVGRGGWSNPARAAAAVDGYQQRAFQNGNGRFGNRLNGPRQATVSA
ncbi:ras GTPase-activating protein-binding protein 2-like isoform X1 [Ananas comosus]|uniref:Ras GTPase-activating protein-binding protein 2-like isoform X1 n=1 Tax=Ananas comosus TaxID=4615 RepID=A0A6P5G629_ANACO|nr:ras GTPase-activating protein-binding protein 2-like isoform X1 [Ananas comosus]